MKKGMKLVKLDKDGMKPLYMQVKDELKQQIDKGIYVPNQKIPSERELCEKFNVSRITVRQALEEAIKDGYLYRHHGRGTFVTDKQNKFGQSLEEVLRFDDLLKSKGHKGKTEILSTKTNLSDMEISSVLQLEVGSSLLDMKLVGYSEGKPVVLYESYVLEDIGVELLKIAQKLSDEDQAFSSIDLYRHYKGNKPTKMRQSIEAISAEGKLVHTLDVTPGHPLMKVTSVFLLADDKPVEFRKAYYLGENYIFYLTRNLKLDE